MSTSPVDATTTPTNNLIADLRRPLQSGKNTADPDRLLTTNEVAEWLGVSKAWVYDHATRKKPFLPCVRLGEITRFRRAEIESFIQEHARSNGSA
jgi:excisionase family DNA binding protein